MGEVEVLALAAFGIYSAFMAWHQRRRAEAWRKRCLQLVGYEE